MFIELLYGMMNIFNFMVNPNNRFDPVVFMDISWGNNPKLAEKRIVITITIHYDFKDKKYAKYAGHFVTGLGRPISESMSLLEHINLHAFSGFSKNIKCPILTWT